MVGAAEAGARVADLGRTPTLGGASSRRPRQLTIAPERVTSLHPFSNKFVNSDERRGRVELRRSGRARTVEAEP
jgi:hypothetical protein